MRSSWIMWEPTWVSRSRCWLLPESRLGHVCMSPEPVGSTHLRFGDARVVKICICSNPNVVRSPGRDPGRHKEFRNGPEVKIYIWKVIIRTSGQVSGLSVLYRDHRRVPGGPPGGATYPGGPHGLYEGGNQPIVGCCASPPWAHAPRAGGRETLKGAPPLFGGKAPLPWPPPPPRRSHLLGPAPPLGGYIKGGE